jgi:phospholipid-binding lipoprotein MlaA
VRKLRIFGYVGMLLLLLEACSSTAKKVQAKSVASDNLENPADGDSGLVGEDDYQTETELPENDPFEGYNRKIHTFNDFFFHYGVYPLAKGWKFITPEFVREGFNNFFTWVYTPGRLVNNLFQGKVRGAAKETAGFAINGTVGVLGLYDAAKDIFSIRTSNEDTDQTLGKWGFSEGIYIVWPFIGPYTVRGTFGFAGDVMLQPQTIIVPEYIQPETIWTQAAIVAGTYSVRAINRTSLNPEEYDDLIKDSIDPYIFIRDIYLQNTRKNVAD